jgi:hypothetical protein
MLPFKYVNLASSPKFKRAAIRDICGFDEQIVTRVDTATAIHLLDRVLVEIDDVSVKPGEAINLTAADRDYLLSHLYERIYATQIMSTLTCRACQKLFDVDFDLPDLRSSITSERYQELDRQDGWYLMPDGQRFRPPTGEDEIAVRHLPPDEAEQELLRRCFPDWDSTLNFDVVIEALETAAPLMDLELSTVCPECGFEQKSHFDMQSYLLTALRMEQKRLAEEVHLIATHYGWRLAEILGLTRTQRQTYVALIEADIAKE